MRRFMRVPLHRGGHGLPHDPTTPIRMAGPWDRSPIEVPPVIAWPRVSRWSTALRWATLPSWSRRSRSPSGRLSRHEAAEP